MVRTSALAGIDRTMLATFGTVLEAAGAAVPATIAPLDVSVLGRLAPGLLVCDIDALDVDPLELLRRIRFVLPECTIVVYTGIIRSTWCVACHLAGANCLLVKNSDRPSLTRGVRGVLRSGCYSDPRFAAA